MIAPNEGNKKQIEKICLLLLVMNYNTDTQICLFSVKQFWFLHRKFFFLSSLKKVRLCWKTYTNYNLAILNQYMMAVNVARPQQIKQI